MEKMDSNPNIDIDLMMERLTNISKSKPDDDLIQGSLQVWKMSLLDKFAWKFVRHMDVLRNILFRVNPEASLHNFMIYKREIEGISHHHEKKKELIAKYNQSLLIFKESLNLKLEDTAWIKEPETQENPKEADDAGDFFKESSYIMTSSLEESNSTVTSPLINEFYDDTNDLPSVNKEFIFSSIEKMDQGNERNERLKDFLNEILSDQKNFENNAQLALKALALFTPDAVIKEIVGHIADLSLTPSTHTWSTIQEELPKSAQLCQSEILVKKWLEVELTKKGSSSEIETVLHQLRNQEGTPDIEKLKRIELFVTSMEKSSTEEVSKLKTFHETIAKLSVPYDFTFALTQIKKSFHLDRFIPQEVFANLIPQRMTLHHFLELHTFINKFLIEPEIKRLKSGKEDNQQFHYIQKKDTGFRMRKDIEEAYRRAFVALEESDKKKIREIFKNHPLVLANFPS